MFTLAPLADSSQKCKGICFKFGEWILTTLKCSKIFVREKHAKLLPMS